MKCKDCGICEATSGPNSSIGWCPEWQIHVNVHKYLWHGCDCFYEMPEPVVDTKQRSLFDGPYAYDPVTYPPVEINEDLEGACC